MGVRCYGCGGRLVESMRAGDQVRRLDGTYGAVARVQVASNPQPMYNLTVADAHTFFVGDGAWLVHNACNWLGGGISHDPLGNELMRHARVASRSLGRADRRTTVAVAEAHGDRIITAFIGTTAAGRQRLQQLAPKFGARYVEPDEFTSLTGLLLTKPDLPAHLNISTCHSEATLAYMYLTR